MTDADPISTACSLLRDRYPVRDEQGGVVALPSLLRQLLLAMRSSSTGTADKVSGTPTPPVPLSLAARDLLADLEAQALAADLLARVTLGFTTDHGRGPQAVGKALRYLPQYVGRLVEVGEPLGAALTRLVPLWVYRAERLLGLTERDVQLARPCHLCGGPLLVRELEWGEREVYCANTGCRDADGARNVWSEQQWRYLKAEWGETEAVA